MPDDPAPAAPHPGTDLAWGSERGETMGTRVASALDAPAVAKNSTHEPPVFPADTRTLAFSAADFARSEAPGASFLLSNTEPSVLHVRLQTEDSWLRVAPSETALGPGEQQTVRVEVLVEAAKTALHAGAAPLAAVRLVFQRLFPGASGIAPSSTGSGIVYVRLPFAACPACRRALEEDGSAPPEVCPFCFERLRACPLCGTANSWLARVCVLDPQHVIRAQPDWPTLGGGADHAGSRTPSRRDLAVPALTRSWSFPSLPPTLRETALAWSAPVAAYGLVACAAATPQGDAHVYAFETARGAPLWEPYPLPDPVYPERGGAALAQGRLFAATVEGLCVGLDAQRGTRVWETALDARVYGAVVPVEEADLLLVCGATSGQTGCLYVLNAASGQVVHAIVLPGPPDAAPAATNQLAFVHDNTGTLTAVDLAGGGVRWSAACGAGFDAAPVVRDGAVFSATRAGSLWCHDAQTGGERWRLAVTGTPLGGTPACDGTLICVPGDDGVYLISTQGRSVRRYGSKRPVRAAPVFAGSSLFFGATDGTVYGVDAHRSLHTLYETGVGSQIAAAPALADGTLFVAATNGVLYALSVG